MRCKLALRAMGYALHIGTGLPRLLTRPGRTARARMVGIVLLAFALRALIPLGFMPASDGTFSLMICPGGLPAGILDGLRSGKSMGHGMGEGMGVGMAMSGGTTLPQPQHLGAGHGAGHGQGLMDQGYCAFTTGFSSAPPPPLLFAVLLVLSCIALVVVTVLAPAGIRLVHLPQARAPPTPF
jgi:hypothetical protein